jgi:hypothetical protein
MRTSTALTLLAVAAASMNCTQPAAETEVGSVQLGLLQPRVSTARELSGTYTYGAEIIAYQALVKRMPAGLLFAPKASGTRVRYMTALTAPKQEWSTTNPDASNVSWHAHNIILGSFDSNDTIDVLQQINLNYPDAGPATQTTLHRFRLKSSGFPLSRKLDDADTYGTTWNSSDRVLEVGDFNGDGRDDILMQPKGTAGNRILYVTNNTGVFERVLTQKANPDANGVSWHADDAILHVGDFNGDKKSDVLVQSRVTTGLSALYLSTAEFAKDSAGKTLKCAATTDCPTGFSCNAQECQKNGLVLSQSWTSGTSWAASEHTATVGDFDGDGAADVFLQPVPSTRDSMVVGFTATGRITKFNRDSATSDGVAWDKGRAVWHVGDFNGDGRKDLFIQPQSSTGTRALYVSNGSALVLAMKFNDDGSGYSWGRDKKVIRVGDFDADGKDDLFLQGETGANDNGFHISTGTNFTKRDQFGNPDAAGINWSADLYRSYVVRGKSEPDEIILTINGKPLTFDYEPGNALSVTANGAALTPNEKIALGVFQEDLWAALPPEGSRYSHQDALVSIVGYWSEHDAISTIEDDVVVPADPTEASTEQPDSSSCTDGTDSCLTEMGTNNSLHWHDDPVCCNPYTSLGLAAEHDASSHSRYVIYRHCGRSTDSCKGRCGPACRSSGVHMHDCFDHDWCTYAHPEGSSLMPSGPCGNEWLQAADDFVMSLSWWARHFGVC